MKKIFFIQNEFKEVFPVNTDPFVPKVCKHQFWTQIYRLNSQSNWKNFKSNDTELTMFLPWDKGQPKETQGTWYCHLTDRERERER